MAKKEEDAPQPVHRLPVNIIGQYLKDLSVENPNAPGSLYGDKGEPTIDVGFSMDAQKVDLGQGDHTYGVTLGVQAQAKRGDEVAFIVEAEYTVLVAVDGVPEKQVHPLLLIEMPRYAFPYVRQIISDATQQAGFVPLLLTPVDFKAFYMERYGVPEGSPGAAVSGPESASEEEKSEESAA